ncbi:MAG: ATP synthase F1 subunit gamma [Phycisphaerales bacterium]|jgi:F-type H+-transporting ATPase subunit gamma
MGKTREIKKRIKAVANIRRITKTMQMIATSKFARAQQAATASKPYTQTLFDLVSELAAGLGEVTHPLLDSGSRKAAGKDLTLVLTSDRGLCGPYNGSVLRTAMQFFRTTPSAKSGMVEVAGKKGVGFFKFAAINVSKLHALGDKPTYATVQAIAEDLIARFRSGELSTVRVVYMKYLSAGRQAPTVMQLLPFQPPKKEAGKSAGPAQVFEFSPDAATLLGELLPAAVKALLFQAVNDAVVSEHVARMVAMKSATDNAGKMGKRLTRSYNRARQAQITTELTEIISGAAALS